MYHPRKRGRRKGLLGKRFDRREEKELAGTLTGGPGAVKEANGQGDKTAGAAVKEGRRAC